MRPRSALPALGLFLAAALAAQEYPPGTFELTPKRDLGLQPVPLVVPGRFAGEVPGDITLNMPPGFSARVFASTGLVGPRSMAWSPDGVLHVASMRLRSEVVALPDGDGDGVADEWYVAAGGFRWLHSITFFAGDLYAADTHVLVRLSDGDGDGVYEERVELAPLPEADDDLHPARTVVIDELREKIYVNVGSTCDVCREETPERAAVLEFDLDGSNRRVFASGLRNATGLELHPSTNELWGVVNGHDREGSRLPPERIDIIRDGGFYGWPFAYAYRSWVDFSVFQYTPVLPITRQDSLLVASVPRPVALAPARLAPMGIHFYTSDRFPPEYRNAAFIAFRSGHRAAVPGYKVMVLFVEPDGSGAVLADFMTGLGPLVRNPAAAPGEGVRGQPVGVLSDAGGNLYVTSDFVNDMVIRVTFQTATAIEEAAAEPAEFELEAAFPNPFNARTAIRYSLHAGADVELALFDVTGRRVATLFDGLQTAGMHAVFWNGRTDSGIEAASGVYFYRLQVGDRQRSRKLLLLR